MMFTDLKPRVQFDFTSPAMSQTLLRIALQSLYVWQLLMASRLTSLRYDHNRLDDCCADDNGDGQIAEQAKDKQPHSADRGYS